MDRCNQLEKKMYNTLIFLIPQLISAHKTENSSDNIRTLVKSA